MYGGCTRTRIYKDGYSGIHAFVPPVWLQSRVAVQDEEIAGYHIPANSSILLSSYVTHHRSDLWSDSEQFIPERFDARTASERSRYAYFPFGGGRHTCPGEPLAMIEMTMILAAILQNFHLHLRSAQTVPIAVTTLRPKECILLSLERRGM
jgi:cytochrome P450